MAQKNLPPEFIKQLFTNAKPLVEQAAQKIAGALPDELNPGYVMKTDANGRPVAITALRVPQGAAEEAKNGHQIKAAIRAGCDIHRYGR